MEKCAVIVCTSGSSGTPKLARVSHRQQLQPYTWINEFDKDFLIFNTSSPYWLTFYNSLISHSISTQKRLITTKQFTSDLCFDFIERYRLNLIFILPSYLSLLTESPRFESADWNCIKDFITGGLYVSPTLRTKIQNKLTNGNLKIGYGMTGEKILINLIRKSTIFPFRIRWFDFSHLQHLHIPINFSG